MKASDILDSTDPGDLRNIVYRLRQGIERVIIPPLSQVVNEAPTQYSPQSSDIGSDLGWFNVKDYGALGDGVADDTQAVNNALLALTTAGLGVLYFPPGRYLTSGGFTLSVPCLVLGVGSSNVAHEDAVSEVLCNSATATLFTVSADKAHFWNIGLTNNAGSTPSAGAAITVTSSNIWQRVDYERVSVYGFYVNIDIQKGALWRMQNCHLEAPILYALRVGASAGGHWVIDDCFFITGAANANAAIRIEGTAGWMILGTNIGQGLLSGAFEHGIDFVSPASQMLTIANCVIGNVRGHGIQIAGSTYSGVDIHGIHFYLSDTTSNNTGNAINISGVDYLTISDCSLKGGATPAAISLGTVNHARIVGNTNRTFSSLVSQTSCTDVVIVEPGTSVSAETSYGQAAAVGTSGFYAREDHTHGTPALSTATPQAVGSAGAPGSGSTPSKNDHVHEGVHSLAKSGSAALDGDVTLSPGANITLTQAGNDIEITATGGGGGTALQLVMETGVTHPPVPVETPDGTDWVYYEV